MANESQEHPVLALPEAQRVEYLSVVASVIMSDGTADPRELSALSACCQSLSLSREGENAVLRAARRVDKPAMDALLAWIRKDPSLAHSLMVDVIVLVLADGKISPSETAQIAAMGRSVGIPVEQSAIIGHYVEAVVANDKGDPEPTRLSEELAEGIIAADKKLPSVGWVSRLYKKVRGDKAG